MIHRQEDNYRVMLVAQSLRVGGAEIMVENLAYALRRQGCVVSIVVLHAGETLITKRLVKNGISISVLGKRKGIDVSVIGRLSKAMVNFAPDVVHSNLPVLQYVVPAAKIAGVKNLVHTVHNMADKETKSKFKRLVNKFCYRNGLVTPVALSCANKQSVIDLYNLDETDVMVVSNGIDLSAFQPKRDYRIVGKAHLCHIGRFEEAKNHLALIAAAARLKADGIDFVFDLYGVGSLKDDIQEAVTRNDLTGEFVFHGLTDNIPAALAGADLFVFPSLYEGMPMVLAEAMASGLPIVVSPVGGVPDMLTNGKDSLYCDLESGTLANCIEQILDDSKMRESLGIAARERAAAFSSDAMAASYLEVYRRGGDRSCL